MRLRDLIPGLGEKGTRERWEKLENKAGTLPVMFALFFTKSVEITALAAPDFPQEEMFNVLTMLTLAVITAIIYVYNINLENLDIIE